MECSDLEPERFGACPCLKVEKQKRADTKCTTFSEEGHEPVYKMIMFQFSINFHTHYRKSVFSSYVTLTCLLHVWMSVLNPTV